MEHLQTHTQRRMLESGLMRVRVYMSKNQENLKLLSNINVYVLNADSITQENNQERENRGK